MKGLKITTNDDKGYGELTGQLNAGVYDAIRDMPGRRRWQGRTLVFDLTRANIEYLKEHLPEAEWVGTSARVIAVEHAQLMEEDVLARKHLPPEALKFAYKTQPREHQTEAFALSRDARAFALFMEMGLGKTKVALDTAAHLYASGKINTLLVAAPNGVHEQWVEEQVPVHLPDWTKYKCLVYRSPSNRTKRWEHDCEELFAYDEGLRVFSMNTEGFQPTQRNKRPAGAQFAERVLSSSRALWALDESIYIKTPGSRRTKEVLRLRDLAAYRRILSGAPVTKGLEDLYTQLLFLDDDVHGFTSFYTYRNRYCVTRQIPGAPAGAVQIVGYRNVAELQHKVDAWGVRQRAADILKMEEPVYAQRRVEFTPEQKKAYVSLRDEFYAQVDDGSISSADQAIVQHTRLQQVLSGHIRDDEGRVHILPNNRVPAVVQYAEELNEKFIVWAKYHPDIDQLMEALKEFNPVVYDGRLTAKAKGENKRRFINDDQCRVFVANPAAAGTGTDGLQHAAHHMIYFNNSFKYTDRAQSTSRLYRDGQKSTVVVTDLVIPGTLDTKILAVLKSRRNLSEVALDIRGEI